MGTRPYTRIRICVIYQILRKLYLYIINIIRLDLSGVFITDK